MFISNNKTQSCVQFWVLLLKKLPFFSITNISIMKKLTLLICIAVQIAQQGAAQTTPPVTAPPPAFQPRQLTPEQQAAADKLAADRKADYENMLGQLHLTPPLRIKPVSAYGLPNSANYDEAKANPYPIPDALTLKNGKK